MKTLGIDPGRECLAWAVVGPSGRYVSSGLSRIKTVDPMRAARHHLTGVPSPAFGGYTRVYIETPQFDGRMIKWGERAITACLDLSVIAGYLAGSLDTPAELITPRRWKGSLRKEIHHRRLLMQFSETCQARIATDLARAPVSLQHNQLDAIGIALWGSNDAKP